MMQTAQSYDGKKYPECAPYHGARGQTWETFIRDFAAAMSTRDVADDSLEDTLYGLDVICSSISQPAVFMLGGFSLL